MTYKLTKAQQTALTRAFGKKGYAFFMEMGLGKTLTALTEYLDLRERGIVTRAIVVCPNSFKSGWVEEIKKHGLEIDTCIFNSGSSANLYWVNTEANKPRMLIINYEAIRSAESRNIVRRFMDKHKIYIVFDESIQLKTNDSKQTRAGIELAKECAVRRILSGKPISQGPHDLWAQLRAIGSLDGKNYFAFRNRYCKMGGYMGKQVRGAQNEQELAGIMAPISFWASKEEYLDIPPKSYSLREYGLHKDVFFHYCQMYDEFVTYLSDTEYVAVDTAITKYIKLAQIQCGFIIDEDGNARDLVPPEKNTRLQLLKDILANEVDTKVIIPYFHKHAGKMLHEQLIDYKPVVIGGGMTSEVIEANKREFNENPWCRLCLGQIQKTKYGHTLLGGPKNVPKSMCHTMIFFENTYSLDDRSQIEDRIHRMGQYNPTLYVDFYGTGLDRNVVQALQRKEGIFQAIVRAVASYYPKVAIRVMDGKLSIGTT